MRDGLRCLSAAGNRLYHWGLKTVARSTFADANNSRPVGFFQDLFAEIYALCAAKAPKHKFRFKSKLFSLDATTIKLCLSLFPWASFTAAKTHESRMTKALDYQKFLSRLGLSVQQLSQVIQLNLLGAASLEELLNPRRRKNENTYNLSLLDLAA